MLMVLPDEEKLPEKCATLNRGLDLVKIAVFWGCD
jgi:hypothetical protein